MAQNITVHSDVLTQKCRACLLDKHKNEFYASRQESGIAALCKLCVIKRNAQRAEQKKVKEGIINFGAIPKNIAHLEWREVPKFPCYEVSESGHIRKSAIARRERYKLLRPHTDKDGYFIYSLSHNGSAVRIKAHRAVLMAFVGFPDNKKPFACHLDGNKQNNHWSNLYWGSAKDNYADARKHGTAWLHGRKTREVMLSC